MQYTQHTFFDWYCDIKNQRHVFNVILTGSLGLDPVWLNIFGLN